MRKDGLGNLALRGHNEGRKRQRKEVGYLPDDAVCLADRELEGLVNEKKKTLVSDTRDKRTLIVHALNGHGT